jgi:hypothetical protein
VIDAFHDQEIQNQIKFTLLRVLRDPEFKAELTKQVVSVSGDPILQDSITIMLSNVMKEEKIQDALSEIASRTLVEVANNEAVTKEMSDFTSKIIHMTMKDYRLYNMFFGSNDKEYDEAIPNPDQFLVSQELKMGRNSRSRPNKLKEIQKKVQENPVDLNDFSSRIRGFNLQNPRNPLIKKLDKMNSLETKLKDSDLSKFEYIVHQDSMKKREILKQKFNKNLKQMNKIKTDESEEDFRRFMPNKEKKE